MFPDAGGENVAAAQVVLNADIIDLSDLDDSGLPLLKRCKGDKKPEVIFSPAHNVLFMSIALANIASKGKACICPSELLPVCPGCLLFLNTGH